MTQMPVKGGVRRKRNTQPGMTTTGTDSSIVRYSCLGLTIGSDTLGNGNYYRSFIPGNAFALSNGTGSSICSFYSTGKFMPGTTIRWEPSVSFSTSGRIYAGFTDNPEVMVALNTAYTNYQADKTLAKYNIYANIVKGLGSVQSFPVWQETTISMPMDTRRKRFDINSTVDFTNADQLDRSSQRGFYVAFDGVNTANLSIGSFWYHDVVSVEGITAFGT